MMIDAATQEEIDRLNAAVDACAGEMKARLREQALKGCRGWDDPVQYERILEMLVSRMATSAPLITKNAKQWHRPTLFQEQSLPGPRTAR
jgi:hypothetical protein